MSKINMIAKAQENVHLEPKAKSKEGGENRGSDVGNEKKANMKGVLLGGSAAEGMDSKPHLGGAVKELHSQHPIKYNDHGPHHGRGEHVRHQPVGKVYK